MAYYHQGTITPAGEKFNSEEASQKLRSAMKGFGTDEKAIISVLCEHSNYERQEIKTKYKVMFGRDLEEDLKSELSGNFETLCLYLLMPSVQFGAYCLHKAMKGLGTDEAALIDIICTKNNMEIAHIKEEYKKRYHKELEEAVVSETSGDLQRILVSLLQGNRNEDQTVDDNLVLQDAKELYEAGTKALGTDESVFNKILVVRSIPHLKDMFKAYAALDDKGIEGAIKAETSGTLQKAFLGIVQCIYNRIPYYAECFHKCLKGAGTDDERLMELVVAHCELDLKDISEAYLKIYGKSLPRMIEDDTSGDYKRLLMKIVNPK